MMAAKRKMSISMVVSWGDVYDGPRSRDSTPTEMSRRELNADLIVPVAAIAAVAPIVALSEAAAFAAVAMPAPESPVDDV
jgi:hypothetical protein